MDLALLLLRWLDRWPRWAAIGFPAVVAGISTSVCHDPRVYHGGDNVLYWALGRSLLEHHAYLNLVAPGEPFETSVPWGLPGLLAGVMALFPEQYGALKLFSWAAMVGAFVALGAFLQHLLRGHRGIAMLTLLICALNQRLVVYGGLVLSEAPFLALSAGALLAYEAYRNRWPDRWLGVAPAALLASYAYLVRPIGISLVAALLGALLLGRRWRALAVALLIVVAVDGSWHVRCLLHPSDEPNLYVDNLTRRSKFQEGDETIDLVGLVERLAHNAAAYMDQPMKEMTLSHGYRWLDFQDLATVLLILAAVGFAVTLNRAGPVHLYVPLYLLALLAWLPEVIKTRYLALVYPVLLAWMLLGLWRLLATFSPRSAAVSVVVTALLLMSFNGTRLQQMSPRYAAIRAAHETGYPDAGRPGRVTSYIQMCLWVEESGRADTILAARKPRLAYFYTGRKAVRVPYANDPAEVFAWLVEHEIDYLLLDRIDSATEKTRKRLQPTLDAYPDHFREEFKTSSGDRVMLFSPTPM